MEKRFASVAGAAEFYAVSKSTIWRRIRSGDLKVYYLGPTPRVDLAELAPVIDASKKPDTNAAA